MRFLWKRACSHNPYIWLVGRYNRVEKSHSVEELGDVGYGVGSVPAWKADFDR